MKGNSQDKSFCMKCFKNRGFVVNEEQKLTKYEGKIVEYTKKCTYCEKCGEPIYVRDIALENMKAIVEAYNKT